jgi:hypothetical protein
MKDHIYATAQDVLYPPSHWCMNPGCRCTTQGQLLKKAEQCQVVLFTLARGPCHAKSVHLYCEGKFSSVDIVQSKY